jgi:membrane-associated protease RseP (regulator of RpoE activity)
MERAPGKPTTNLVLFIATLLSVMAVGREMMVGGGYVAEEAARWWSGWPFALPFLGILVCHEFGHWIAAKLHRVPASLPYFLPVPFVLFGTMGAVITMPERIRSRVALMDIGAAGPLAGIVVAIPTMVVGLKLSVVGPISTGPYYQEGQSLMYLAIKRLVLGPIPAGYDVHLHPTAFAAWGGFLITMINLLPWGQLDGGHIAYALFGTRQNAFARRIRYALLGLFAYNLAVFAWPMVGQGREFDGMFLFNNTTFWLVWFVITGAMARMSGGSEHPPYEDDQLTPGRKLVGVVCLVLFVLLFMPTPLAVY